MKTYHIEQVVYTVYFQEIEAPDKETAMNIFYDLPEDELELYTADTLYCGVREVQDEDGNYIEDSEEIDYDDGNAYR